jgi:nucleotide-binding universal stress UspA family protein
MKFVLATDGSGYSRIAEETLAKLDPACRAEWDVVSVATPLPIAIPSPEAGMEYGGDELSQAWGAISKAHKETAEQVAARLAARGYKTRAVLLEGEPAREIIDYCSEQKADLVAIGSRGLGAFMGFLLGSTARRLVSDAPCSVLIGHAPRDGDADAVAQEFGKKTKLNVIVAADGSDGANQALDKLMELGPFGKGTALCVEPLAAFPSGLNPAEFGAVYRYDSERAMKTAEHAAQRLAQICDSVVPLSELGRPASVLVDVAAKTGSDLIVLGATRHGVIERFLLGSVSHEVANDASVPVLVVRVTS